MTWMIIKAVRKKIDLLPVGKGVQLLHIPESESNPSRDILQLLFKISVVDQVFCSHIRRIKHNGNMCGT